MNVKTKLRDISFAQSVELMPKINILIDSSEIASTSEFYRNAVTWYFRHQTDYNLMVPMGSEAITATCISLTVDQVNWITQFLNIQNRTINRSEFLRLIGDKYFEFRYNSKPIEDEIITNTKEIEIPNYGIVKLGRGEKK